MVAASTERSYRALLRVPSLGRVLLGMGIARSAGTATGLAIVLFALDRYDSPAVAGAVGFAMMFPGIVASPVAGALLDRYGRIRLVVLDYLVAASALSLIGILALADRLPAWLLIAITAIASLTEPLSASGVRSLFPLIVPEPLWERANAADSNMSVLAVLVAPPVAAALVQVWGGPVALVAIAGTFALAALTMAGIPEPPVLTASTGRLLVDAHEGLLYVWHNPALRSLALTISLLNLAFGMLEIAVPVMVLDHLGGSPTVVGAVWAALGAAGMVSALLIGRVDTRGIERQLLVWPMFGLAVATALLLPQVGIWLVFLAAILMGLLNGPIDIGLMILRQRRTDAAWMGRAFAVSMSLNALGTPFGAMIGGWLVGRSLDAAILFGVVATLFAAVVGWATLERRAPAPSRPAALAP